MQTVLSLTLLRAVNIRTKIPPLVFIFGSGGGRGQGAYQVARKKGKALRGGLKVAEAELFYTDRQERAL